MIRDYVRQLKVPPPRHWDFREWSPYVLMLDQNDPDIFRVLSVLNHSTEGRVFIFIGKIAENYSVIIDKSKHDVRDCEPWFFTDDNIDWRIR